MRIVASAQMVDVVEWNKAFTPKIDSLTMIPTKLISLSLSELNSKKMTISYNVQR